jgi:hypothetical protein
MNKGRTVGRVPAPPPCTVLCTILYQSDAAILDQLNAFYSHYNQKNAGKAGRDLQVLFAGNAATELEKALVVKLTHHYLLAPFQAVSVLIVIGSLLLLKHEQKLEIPFLCLIKANEHACSAAELE